MRKKKRTTITIKATAAAAVVVATVTTTTASKSIVDNFPSSKSLPTIHIYVLHFNKTKWKGVGSIA